tara:strand:+ start:1149 stop:1532 length:384 start_codon:yes stop_codon:yes gene_type:complete
MKYRYLLRYYFILFFLPFNSFANDIDNVYLHCNQVPEGNPFGLIFDNSNVSQIGIENFKKIFDYSENYTRLDQEIKWLNVALNLEKLTLHIGNQSDYFAKCEEIKNLRELNKVLESFIISQQYKNTI